MWARNIEESVVPSGVFDGYHGWDGQAQFPALWSHDESVHQTMNVEPNAWLSPQLGRDYMVVWTRSRNASNYTIGPLQLPAHHGSAY